MIFMTWEIFTEQNKDNVSFFSVIYTDNEGEEIDKNKATHAVVREYIEGELIKITHGILN